MAIPQARGLTIVTIDSCSPGASQAPISWDLSAAVDERERSGSRCGLPSGPINDTEVERANETPASPREDKRETARVFARIQLTPTAALDDDQHWRWG